MCCLQETHFKCKDTKRLKVKEWKKDYSTNQKKASVAINIKLISEESVSGQRESFHDDSLRVHNYKCSCIWNLWSKTEFQRETDKFITWKNSIPLSQ